MTSGFHQSEITDILESGWNVSREGLPVLPGTLLNCPRPERVTLPPQEEMLRSIKTILMAEGAGIEPASAVPDTADYKSAPLPVRGNPPSSKRAGGPGEHRTLDLPVSNQTLYPSELQGRWFNQKVWGVRRESNPSSLRYQGIALPLSY
jgi:hypothetical protein